MFTNQDKSYFFDFMTYFEKVKNEASKFHFKDSNVQNFLTTNRIFLGNFSSYSEKKRKKLGYQRFMKMTRVSGHEILRHVRNAIAHGRIEYKSKNVIKLTDYNTRTKAITMKASLRRDILISLIEEIKKSYK